MSYRLITFDVYTALFDIEQSLLPSLRRIAKPAASDIDTVAFLRTWRTKQLEYALINNSLQRGHLSFRAVTQRALEYALRRFHLDLPESDRAELVEAWDHLQPWPEAERVLTEVKARGYPIAVLSNGDEVMLRALIANVAVRFDHVFAADQVGFFKPRPEIYHRPLLTLGLTAAEVLHVAGSATDTLGAKAAGLTCAWSNRAGDLILDARYAPDFEWRDLTGLLTVLS